MTYRSVEEIEALLKPDGVAAGESGEDLHGREDGLPPQAVGEHHAEDIGRDLHGGGDGEGSEESVADARVEAEAVVAQRRHCPVEAHDEETRAEGA